MRHDWKFPMSGTDLLPYADAQQAHHAERLSFWSDQLTRAKEELRSEGITIEDNPEVAAFGDRTVAYQGSVAVRLDPSRVERLNECAQKVREHEDAGREFRRWGVAFARNPDAVYELDISDMGYFRI